MKVIVDPKKCILCGACEVLTQGTIISKGDKTAYLNPKANLENKRIMEKVKIAIESCPVKAIKLS